MRNTSFPNFSSSIILLFFSYLLWPYRIVFVACVFRFGRFARFGGFGGFVSVVSFRCFGF